MHSFAAAAAAALLSALALAFVPVPAHATDSLLADAGWESFADSVTPASFAWAGEDETFAAHAAALGRPSVTTSEDANLDVRSLTGVPAPEPPALVLAGMAFGGVLFGRSMLVRRKRSAAEGSTDAAV